MRIVLFHSQLTSLGGAEILLATQARWLMAAGHDVRVVAFRADNALVAAQLDGIRVSEVGYPRGVSQAEGLRAGMMPALIDRTRPHLRDADVVLALNFPCAPVAAAASDARRVWYACEPFRGWYLREANPVAAARATTLGRSATDLVTQQIARRMRRRRVAKMLLPFAARAESALKAFDAEGVAALDGVASLSHYGASCVQRATGRGDARVIYPMVRMGDASTSPVGARRGLRRDAPQLLTQSRLAIPKNLDTLIRAMAQVRRVHARAVLHVAGGGSHRTTLERLVQESGLGADAVRFHGFLDDAALDTLSAQCDVFALVPVDEPFGMVFPEAAARGQLLVGPDHGGPREILEDGAIGEMADAFEPQSVGDAILRTLAMTDAEVDARRAAAEVSVRARFSAEVIGAQLEELLRG
jgi:glycosyltransferase involved in cell wall biosynthesis